MEQVWDFDYLQSLSEPQSLFYYINFTTHFIIGVLESYIIEGAGNISA